MPEVKWTKEQEQAIFQKNSNILVAAAAGSGKTAVLVERIINKVINEKIDIDKILVVTFTNAAASEMRQRILEAIYKKIDENPKDIHLQRQINLLNKSSICTIHSFCLDVIKNYFYEIDVSANFRIGDTAEIELLKEDVLEELFEEKYLNNDKEFIKLINNFTTYKGDEPLKELILKIYNYIQSAPFPDEWIEQKVEMFNLKENIDFSQTIWGQILLKEFLSQVLESKLKLQNVQKNLNRFFELEKFSTVIANDIDQLEKLEKSIKADTKELWEKTYINANELKFDKWPVDRKATIDYKNEAKEIRDKVKKELDASIKKIFIYNSKEATTDIFDMYKLLVSLKDIILEFEQKFSDAKKQKNIIDFHDIEHYALKILVKKDENGEYKPTDVANKIKEKFNEIDIDEYQDSNLVQENILNSISNRKNIFMVGDVKQSIYKFRQARPELFIEKYEKYLDVEQDNSDGMKIKLFKNFRSRKNILDITNIIFENIMSKELGDINYDENEYLNLGANYEEPPENIKEYAGLAELHIIDLSNKEDEDIYINSEETGEEQAEENEEPIENTLIEAKFVANKIKELIKSNYQVYDRKAGYRKITYKDIVILLRATSNVAPVYEKELTQLDIPVFSDASAEYLDSTEIQTIMSVLKIIDNPMQDIPLVTVLRSIIGSFTDNDLIEIRLADRNSNFYTALIKSRISVKESIRKKIDTFLDNLEKWKKQEEYMSIDEIIWQIYVDTNYYNYVGLLTNGKLRQANLKMLFEKAKQYESASFKGLYNFIGFIDKLKTSSKDMQAAKIIGENDDVVRIMSIHKSKGLEFPIVFLCGTAKRFNMKDLNENILMHQDLGFGPKYIDYDRRIEYSTLAKEAIKIRNRTETISEEMRVLYVALTRAKEKLYITGISKDTQKDLKEKSDLLSMYADSDKIEKNILQKCKSYLDWIEVVYLKNKEKMKSIIELYEHSGKEIQANEEITKEETKSFGKAEDKNKLKEIEEKLNWKYEYELAQKIPTKTSVSKIKEEKNKTLKLKEFLEEEENIQNMSKGLNVPKFAKEDKITSSEKGTLIHLCIKNLDENKNYSLEDIKELIEKLEQKEIITQKEKEAININTLLRYTQSDLYKDLKQAQHIYKEEPFYINVPASQIYDSDVAEKILVQGIIDLYYIDKEGKLILVDFKTDYVENNDERILVEKYKEQLKLYREALEKALNRSVDKTIIYSLYLQKEIIV